MASIRERNGRVCGIYTYRSQDGKKKQKWETYKNKAEALRRKKEIEYKESQGALVVKECKYLKDLLEEYVSLYGKDKWALSTYAHNTAQIDNYILPFIGNVKLQDINAHLLEKYYQQLLKTPPVPNAMTGKRMSEYVSTSTIRDVHKILRNCFEQAVKWELMEKNPATYATVPKHKSEKRKIWTAQQLMRAIEACDDQILKLAMNLTFAGSLRLGELLGLTWDCVDVSEKAIAENNAYLYVEKEVQRVSKEALKKLDAKDIIYLFPENSKLNKTVRVLKTPKTESSIRKVYLPRSVALMLVEWKKEQDEIKEILEDEFHDYNLVLTSNNGTPASTTHIRKEWAKLIRDNNLPDVVFHSLRHTSVTYKLKLNGGDVKAVQGDSGHSQVSMVTDVYSHIIDEDRKKNAELFESAFYGKQNLNPQIHGELPANTVNVPEGVDPALYAQFINSPEMIALFNAMMKRSQGN